MSKGRVFVIVYSVVLIVLFFTFCFLMSIVDPPPISTLRRKVNRSEALLVKQRGIPRAHGRAGQKALKDYLREFPEFGDVKYGLEKVDSSELSEGFNLTTAQPRVYYPRNKNVVYVVPPLWPPTSIYTQNDTTYNDVLNDTGDATGSPVKGHRRSLIDLESKIVHKNGGSLTLKILDDSGHSRIEIKLGPEESGLEHDKHPFSMHIQANDTDNFEKHELFKDTVIKIMPNDTVVFENDSSNMSSEKPIADHVSGNVNLTNEEFTDTPKNFTENNTDGKTVNYLEDIQPNYTKSESTEASIDTEVYTFEVLSNETSTFINDMEEK